MAKDGILLGIGLASLLTLGGCDLHLGPFRMSEGKKKSEPTRRSSSPRVDYNSLTERARDLSNRSLALRSQGKYEGAIHLGNWALEMLDERNPAHFEVMREAYQNLQWIYEDLGDVDRADKMERGVKYINSFRRN